MLILHMPSFPLTDPWILLGSSSQTPLVWFYISFSTHVSQAYVTTGLTYVLYIRSLESLVNTLLLNRCWFV